MIPVGWAREPWSKLQRADWIWLHNYQPDLPIPRLPHQKIVRSWMQPKNWLYDGQKYPLEQWNGLPKLVCGIARPEGVFQQLHNLNIPVSDWLILADHSPLPRSVKDWICTEKDAARLDDTFPIWVLQCELVTEGERDLLDEIQQCCG